MTKFSFSCLPYDLEPWVDIQSRPRCLYALVLGLNSSTLYLVGYTMLHKYIPMHFIKEPTPDTGWDGYSWQQEITGWRKLGSGLWMLEKSRRKRRTHLAAEWEYDRKVSQIKRRRNKGKRRSKVLADENKLEIDISVWL